MEHLSGRVAVVTGGANGIGRAVAVALGAEGMRVAIADLDAEEIDNAVQDVAGVGAEAIGVVTDVRDLEAVEHLAERVEAELGPVSLLHNNAGVGLIEAVATTTPEDWRWAMDVNFFGVVNGVQAFLPRMLERGGEHHIVNTGSLSGLQTTPQLAGYCASKFAVVGLTETMRDELADEGIGVSLLCPGVVGTRIMGRSRKLRNQQSSPAAPLGRTRESGDWEAVRVVSPEEVAQIVVRGVQSNTFYLMTHPEARSDMAERFETILAAFDAAEPSVSD